MVHKSIEVTPPFIQIGKKTMTLEEKKFFLNAMHPTAKNAANAGSVATLVAATSQMIVERNDFRHVLTVQNLDAVTDLYLNKANNVAVQGTGILLRPAGVFQCGLGTDDGYLGRICAISAGGINVGITETSVNIDELLGRE